jgi:isopenicillin-N N-acyltransferase-like protein
MALPILHLSGTPYEQGLAHGRTLSDRIHHNIRVYFERFQRACLIDREEVLSRARRYGAALAQQSPAYFEGMQGIAAGAQVNLEEIIALNVRYEIIYYQTAVLAMAEGAKDGCSAFALAPPATRNGHLLMGQNWDWIPWVQGAILHTVEPDGLETLSFTEAGIYGGKIGLNSAGLGLAVNGMTTTADDWTRLTEPFHLRCYRILRHHNLAAAMEVITGSERACSANYLIAQAPDQAVDVEAAPDVVNSIPWHKHCQVHTNHFLDPQGTGVEEPPNDRRYMSCNRWARLQQLIDDSRPVSVADLQQHLQDHVNAPGSLCRHEDIQAPADEQFRTVTGVVMDLHEKELYITDGPPCQNEFRHIRLDGNG